MIYYSNTINTYYTNIIKQMEKDACFIMDNNKWLLEYISITYITDNDVDSQLNTLRHYVNKLHNQLKNLNINNELDIYIYLFNIKTIVECIIELLDNIYKSPMEFDKFIERTIVLFEQYIKNKYLVLEYIKTIKNVNNIVKISNILTTVDIIILRPVYIINIKHTNLNIHKTIHKTNIIYYYNIIDTTLPPINILDLQIYFDAYDIINHNKISNIYDMNVFKKYFFEIIKQNTMDYFTKNKLIKYTAFNIFHNQIKLLYYNVIKYTWIEKEILKIFDLKNQLNNLLLKGILI